MRILQREFGGIAHQTIFTIMEVSERFSESGSSTRRFDIWEKNRWLTGNIWVESKILFKTTTFSAGIRLYKRSEAISYVSRPLNSFNSGRDIFGLLWSVPQFLSCFETVEPIWLEMAVQSYSSFFYFQEKLFSLTTKTIYSSRATRTFTGCWTVRVSRITVFRSSLYISISRSQSHFHSLPVFSADGNGLYSILRPLYKLIILSNSIFTKSFHIYIVSDVRIVV